MTTKRHGLFNSIEAQESYHQIYDKIVSKWPQNPDSNFIETAKGRTHYLTFGPTDGPPLILLHGANSSSAIWGDLETDLGKKYRVYALDIMGDYGKSVPNDKIKNIADYMEWLDEVLSALKIDSAYFMGFSLGAWLTLNYCGQASHRVKKAILISPAATLKRMKPSFLVRAIYSILIPTHTAIRKFYYYASEKSCQNDIAYSEKMDLLIHLVHTGRKMKAQIVNPTVFTDQNLANIETPLTILIGENEVIYDSRVALKRADRLIPGVVTHLVPKASHDMMYSQPEFVIKSVLEFFRESEGGVKGQ